MAVPVRISEENYAALQKEAGAEYRSATAQLNLILEQRYGTPATFGTAPEKPDVSDLFPKETSSNVRPDVQKIASEPSAPRSRGDVLADIRKLEAERDEELRYCQDAAMQNELALKWMKKIQPLWDEYNGLKEADNG